MNKKPELETIAIDQLSDITGAGGFWRWVGAGVGGALGAVAGIPGGPAGIAAGAAAGGTAGYQLGSRVDGN